MVSLAPASPASGAVLHDQLDNAGNSGAGSTKRPNFDFQTADDFVVPAGQVWTVGQVEATSIDAAPTSSFNVLFFPNSGALPADAPEYSASVASLAPGGGNLTVILPLSPPASLPAGRHWVTVQGNYGAGAEAWNWRGRSVQSGAYKSASRDCSTGTCAAWQTRNDPDPDRLFRLSSAEGSGLPGGPSQGGQLGGGPVDVSPSFQGKPSADPSTFEVNLAGAAETPVTGAARKGTTFRYSLTEAAAVTFTIQRKGRGRRVGRKCRKPTRRNRTRRRCTRYTRVGAFRHQGRAGQNSKPFSGKIGRRVLRPGRYRAVLTARDAAGNRSAPQNVAFRVVKAARRRR